MRPTTTSSSGMSSDALQQRPRQQRIEQREPFEEVDGLMEADGREPLRQPTTTVSVKRMCVSRRPGTSLSYVALNCSDGCLQTGV